MNPLKTESSANCSIHLISTSRYRQLNRGCLETLESGQMLMQRVFFTSCSVLIERAVMIIKRNLASLDSRGQREVSRTPMFPV